jgi:hypothetical protein
MVSLEIPMTTPLLLILAPLFPQSLASEPVSLTDSTTEPAAAEDPNASLEKGLRAIQAKAIRKDLEFIASDEMAGRDTPSPEQRQAARYIRERLIELGFQPGGRAGYLSEYPLSWTQLDTARCSFTVGDAQLVFGEDYVFGKSSDAFESNLTAGLIYAGEGDDGDFEDVEGKWVIIRSPGKSIQRRKSRAFKAGAAGVLLLPSKGDEVLEKNKSVTAKLTKGRLRGSGRHDGPTLVMTADGEKKLVRAIGRSVLKEVGATADVEGHEVRGITHARGYRLFENVCGFWPGSDPELSKEVLIISAHYDHVGVQGGKIHNGADDNGSGTCGLLALSKALSEYGPMRRSVLVMWVSGEEKGLLGSRGWTKRPWLPEGCFPVADINIDMIGRNAPDDLMITPTKNGRVKHEYNGLVRLAEQHAESEGFGKFRSADDYWDRSDHANFAKHLGLPVTFLFADVHEDYHQPGDDPDKIDYDKIRRVVRLVLRMLDDMQEDDLVLHDRPIPTYEEFLAQMQAGMVQDDLERWRAACDYFRSREGRHAANLGEVLGHEAARVWNLTDALKLDPWGQAYRLDAEGLSLHCLGADGAEGGEGAEADSSLATD